MFALSAMFYILKDGSVKICFGMRINLLKTVIWEVFDVLWSQNAFFGSAVVSLSNDIGEPQNRRITAPHDNCLEQLSFNS